MTAPLECSPYGIAGVVMAALQDRLIETRAGVPERMAIYPHALPAIEFCSMGWVGFRSIRPGQLLGRGACGVADWEVGLTVGVARCWPVEEGNAAPAVPAVDSAARDALDDCEAMHRAVEAVRELGLIPTVGVWTPLSPMGGGHGGTLEVTVTAGLGVYCDEVAPMLPGDPRA